MKDLPIIPLNADGIPTIKWGMFNKDNLPPPYEVGALMCGEISGMIGLDIDSDEEELKIMAMLDGSQDMLAKKGSKGRTIFFKYHGEQSKSWKKDGKVVLELLSDKRLTTIPPELHRVSGKPYEWINEGAELKELPSNILVVFDALYPAPERTDSFSEYPTSIEFDKVELDEVEEMLKYISPDATREEWLKVGMALRDEFGDAAAMIWDGWSSGSGKYKAHEIRNIWRSFNGSGVGIGTLVYMAQEGGWVRKVELPERNDWEIDLSYLDKKTVKERRQLEAHGLVGEIADWIVSQSYMPQPQLALGGALAFVGMLKGHKVCNNTNLRTNLSILNIAPTSSGKDDPQKLLSRLAREVGLHKHMMAKPTSGTAILTGLKKADRVALLSVDEVGRFLEIITSKTAGGHLYEIISYLLELTGKANSELSGKQYADDVKTPTTVLINPHLCVLGSSVKQPIVNSCTSDQAIDGFLNRWVLFETEDEPDPNDGANYKAETPSSIIEGIQKIIDSDPNGNYAIAEDEAPIVKEVRYTPEAWAIFKKFRQEALDLKRSSVDPLKGLYGRTAEHVAKIALTLCDDEFIRTADVELAINIVIESNKLIVDLAGLIADNDQERNVVKVLEVIRKGQPILHRDLVQKTRFLKSRDRKEIVNDLVQSGEVIAEECGKTYTYRTV